MAQGQRKIVVFGVFDGVHDGHRDFFRQAKEYGDELIAVVGRDANVERLKGKRPKYNEEKRVKLVEKEDLIDKAILGDEEFSVYGILDDVNPDVICLGYDQKELAEDLVVLLGGRKKPIEVRSLKPYKPDIYHSSLL